MDKRAAFVAGAFALVGALIGSGLPIVFASSTARVTNQEAIRAEIIRSSVMPSIDQNPIHTYIRGIIQHIMLSSVLEKEHLLFIANNRPKLCWNDMSVECQEQIIIRIVALRSALGLEYVDRDTLKRYNLPAYEAMQKLVSDPTFQSFIPSP